MLTGQHCTRVLPPHNRQLPPSCLVNLHGHPTASLLCEQQHCSVSSKDSTSHGYGSKELQAVIVVAEQGDPMQ